MTIYGVTDLRIYVQIYRFTDLHILWIYGCLLLKLPCMHHATRLITFSAAEYLLSARFTLLSAFYTGLGDILANRCRY